MTSFCNHKKPDVILLMSLWGVWKRSITVTSWRKLLGDLCGNIWTRIIRLKVKGFFPISAIHIKSIERPLGKYKIIIKKSTLFEHFMKTTNIYSFSDKNLSDLFNFGDCCFSKFSIFNCFDDGQLQSGSSNCQPLP
jgi:hypothetical protein